MSTAGTVYESLQNLGGGRHGHMRYVNATTLRFIPWGGDRIKINGSWRTIPAAGITITNPAGNANKLMYVFASWDGSNVVVSFFDASTTSHRLSTADVNAGVEIMTGNEAYSLIGMVRLDASSQFVDTEARRWVRSWFNRHLDKRVLNFTGATSNTTSNSFVAMDATWLLDFASWANEVITCHLFCSCWNNTAGTGGYIALVWDGTNYGTPGVGSAYGLFTDAGQNWHNMSYSDSETFSTDGRHTVVPMFSTAGGLFAGVGGGGNPLIQLNGRIG